MGVSGSSYYLDQSCFELLLANARHEPIERVSDGLDEVASGGEDNAVPVTEVVITMMTYA